MCNFVLFFLKRAPKIVQASGPTKPGSAPEDRQCIYKRNIEARSRNHCCRGKAISVTYSEYASIALVKAHVLYYIVICGLPGSTMFLHIIS
jgi:hypothetical protein